MSESEWGASDCVQVSCHKRASGVQVIVCKSLVTRELHVSARITCV
jgi:hypothetical protein